MDILLTANDTFLNKIVRKTTNSSWGHASIVIDDIVYDFDYNEKNKLPLSSIISDSSISKATLFCVDMLDKEKYAENLYKYLFDKCEYNSKSLYRLRDKIVSGRDLESIQDKAGSYNCSSLIAKVYSNYVDSNSVPDYLKDIHWSQYIPDDYSSMEFKGDII